MIKSIHTLALFTILTLSLANSALGQNNQSPPLQAPDNATAKPNTPEPWIKDVAPVKPPKDSIVLESQQGKPSFVNPPNTCINMSMEQWNQLQGDTKAIRDQLNELKSSRDEMRKMMMDRGMPPPGDMQKPN